MNIRAITGVFFMMCCALGSSAQTTDDSNFMAALTDVAANRACDRLENQFRGLEFEGRDGQPSVTGTLWIKNCRAQNVEGDPRGIALSINAVGWRWIYREKEKLGAEFEVSDYAKFEVAVKINGRLDAVYDPKAKVMVLWFLPKGEPGIRFSQVGDIDVDEEGLWASVLGGVASVFIHSPEKLASETIQQMGRKKLEQKLTEGFSVAADFCTGQTFMKLAKLSKEQLISSVEQKPPGETKRVHMHPEGLIIAGPFNAESETLQIKVNGTSANQLQARLICLDFAERLAEMFIKDKSLPDDRILATNEGGSLLTVEAAPGNCPVALVARPAGKTERPFNFSYRVTEQRPMMPLADCN